MDMKKQTRKIRNRDIVVSPGNKNKLKEVVN